MRESIGLTIGLMCQSVPFGGKIRIPWMHGQFEGWEWGMMMAKVTEKHRYYRRAYYNLLDFASRCFYKKSRQSLVKRYIVYYLVAYVVFVS